MPIVIGTPVDQVPTSDAQSPDGRIRATVMPDSAGVFIRVDYTSLFGVLGYEWPNPFRLSVYRQTPDGVVTAVRGAGNVSQYGGIFHAYDDEVTFGQQVVYWAEAPTLSGDEIVETDKVAVLTWEPDGGFTQPGVWIKNLEEPDLSVPARCLDWSGGSWASRNATADIWGGAAPAVTTDVRKSYNTQMTLLTKDEEEYQALLSAVNASVVYIVGLERHRRRTGYYLIGDISPIRIGQASSTYDAWSVALTGMERPKSAGHSLSVPGRSYADRKRAYETYDLIPYASSFIRAPALTTTTTTRIAVDAAFTVPITSAVNYTIEFTAKLSSAAAARNLYAGLSYWDVSNNPLTSNTGADILFQPGETKTVNMTASSATGVKTRPFLTGKSMTAGEHFELIDAKLYLTSDTTKTNILLAPDTGPFTSSMGHWVDLGNSAPFLMPGYRRTYGAGTEPY